MEESDPCGTVVGIAGAEIPEATSSITFSSFVAAPVGELDAVAAVLERARVVAPDVIVSGALGLNLVGVISVPDLDLYSL